MAGREDTDAVAGLSLEPVVREAMKRFKRCAEWESDARQNFLDDLKFAHGDADNGYQWPNRIRQNRDVDSRPCLTMNIIRQHNLQIINESKQNKQSVRFKATGGQATKECADLLEAMFQQVEYMSEAQSAYETALEYQVTGGWGWIRMVTEYEDNKSFNQCFRVKRVWDPLSVYLDMDIQEKNGSDARYGFVFDLVPDEELLEAYPRLKDKLGTTSLGGLTSEDSWNIKDHTRVCEYFRKVPKADKLVSFIDPQSGQRKELKKSLMPQGVYGEISLLPLTKERDIVDWEVQWFLIVGQKVVDKTVWPGKYIPLVRVLGEETVIEGRMDRKGHTRAMKDAQRMYNYNASAQVEFVALQGKTPWLVAAKAIEEYESMWNTANVVNHSVLVYNHISDDGTAGEIPAPSRTDPPQASSAYDAGMQTAFDQMMMTSGQWQNQMGMGGNERTGAAIERRQDQGFTAVFHFQNNYAEALRYVGKQFLDLVPIIYDTARLLKLQMLDGEDFDLELDPRLKQPLQVYQDESGKVIRRIMNPSLGEYAVQADVGPAYGTRREETVRAMTLLLTQNPDLVPIIGDLLLQAMDFKESQEAAQRLKRMVPPEALGTGPSKREQELQQSIDSLKEALTQAMQEMGKKEIKLLNKDELREVNVYDADTRRMTALKEVLPLDKAGLTALVKQLIADSLQTTLTPITQDNLTANPGGIPHAS